MQNPDDLPSGTPCNAGSSKTAIMYHSRPGVKSPKGPANGRGMKRIEAIKERANVWISGGSVVSRENSALESTLANNHDALKTPLSERSEIKLDHPAERALGAAEAAEACNYGEQLELVCTRQQVLQEQLRNSQKVIEQLEKEQEIDLLKLIENDKELLEHEKRLQALRQELDAGLKEKERKINNQSNYKKYLEEKRQTLENLRKQLTLTVETINDLGSEKDRILYRYTDSYMHHK